MGVSSGTKDKEKVKERSALLRLVTLRIISNVKILVKT